MLMPSDQPRGHRRSIRLPGYDYAQPGAYFVTICTHGGEWVLGDVVDGEIVLTDWGHIVVESWKAIPAHFPNVETDAFVVMPNHVHGVLVIAPDRRGTACRAYDDDGIIWQASERVVADGHPVLQIRGIEAH
jgi:putative transposase